MPIIKVKAESFAGDDIEQKVLDAANSATPAGVTPQKAKITRDSNGKLVSVDVGLPADLAANDLAAAKAAIEANSGVSSASALPISGTEGFESGYSAGANISNSEISTADGIVGLLINDIGQNSAWEVTQIGDAITGNVSIASDYTDTSSKNSHGYQATIRMTAADNGLSEIRAFKMRAKFEYPDVYNSVTKDKGDLVHNAVIDTGHFGNLQLFNGTWWMFVPGQAFTNTGLAEGASLDIELSVDPLGVHTLTEHNSGTTLSNNPGFPFSLSQTQFSINISEYFSVAQVADIKSMVVDDIVLEILDGE